MRSRTSATALSALLLMAAFVCTASLADAAAHPNPSQGDLAVDANDTLTFELDQDAEVLGTADADGKFSTKENGTVAPHADVDTYIYTPAADFNGEDEFKYEICAPDCTEYTATIQVGAADFTLVIQGPEEAATYTLNPNNDVVVAYGNSLPFKPVKLLIDDEDAGTANADGKGAWTRNLTFDEDSAGEHTLIAEDENGNTTQVTFTLVWEDSADNGDTDERLPGEDPNVANAGGRLGSCSSFSAAPTSTGLGVFSLLVGFAFIRRSRRARA